MILTSLDFYGGKTFCGIIGYTVEILGVGLRGMMSDEGGCQYPEWIIDRPAILRLANNGYTKEKDR